MADVRQVELIFRDRNLQRVLVGYENNFFTIGNGISRLFYRSEGVFLILPDRLMPKIIKPSARASNYVDNKNNWTPGQV